jgi:hypothetical protein
MTNMLPESPTVRLQTVWRCAPGFVVRIPLFNDQLEELLNDFTIGNSEFVGFRVNDKEFMPNTVAASEMVVASCWSVSTSERTAP